MGSIAFGILADTKNFTNGVKATRAEIKILRSAFVDAQRPVERFSSAIQHLEGLMAKFPTRAGEVRRSIHAIKAEMDSVRFARGAAWEAGFAADLNAGLARNRAGGGGMGGGGAVDGPSGGFLRLNQGVGVASKAITAMRSGSVLPLIASLGNTGLAGVAIAAGAALAALAGKAIMAADKVRQSREEFFKQVDALKAAGGDVAFSKDLERVRSLSTAWTEAKTRYEDYLAKIGERSGGVGLGVRLLDSGLAEGAFAPQLGHDLANAMPGQGPAGITGLDRANLAAAAARQKDAFAAYHERIRLAKEASDAEIAFNEKFDQARRAADLRAYEARRDHFDAELKERLSKLNAQLEAAATLREKLRTPGERMGSELDEIMGNPRIDAATRLRALEALRARAEGMIPDAGGRAHARSIGGIRAGSVEALRAQHAGGTDKSERELKAAEKTEKHTADAVTALGRIEAAISKIELGEAP